MKINYIKVRGAIGFKKGLGKDEVEFDFKDKTGLVALAGPNGKGKTTLLELMSPYRTFASRKGALRHHFFLRDSFIETKFEYNGSEYHTIRKIDSGSDRAEAFIVVDGESVVNGKLKEYDNYIIDLFGSQTLFYNSVFCAQGSGNLSDMTTGKIKELFVEFLRIERLAEYEAKAKEGISFFQKKLDKLSGEISACEESLKDFEHTEAEIKQADIKIKSKRFDIDEIEKTIESSEKEIAALKDRSLQQAENIKRKVEIEARLKKLIADHEDIASKIDIESGKHSTKLHEFEREIISIDTILADKDKILNASARIENLEKWEKYFSECFECSIDEQAKFDQGIKDIDQKKSDISKKITDLENDLILDGLKTTVKYCESMKVELDSNHSILNSKLKSANNDFSLLQASQAVIACKEKIAVSIDPDCISKTCPAIKMVSSAKEELPLLEKAEQETKIKVDAIIDEIETAIKICTASLIDIGDRVERCSMGCDMHSIKIYDEIRNLMKESDKLSGEKASIYSDFLIINEFKGFYKSKLSSTRDMIGALKDLSSKKSQVEIAEEKKLSIEKQIAQLENDFAEKKKDHADRVHALSIDITKEKNIVSSIDAGLDLELDKKLDKKTEEKVYASLKKDKLANHMSELSKTIAVLKNNLMKKEELSGSLNEKNQAGNVLKKELSEWDYLRLACSKTGLQALEIDGAAPLITTEANTLLEKAFGLDSQIKIITQDPESGKEVFWINVIREDGAEDDFGNLSGGQKVWISHALSLGMTLVSKRKSGRAFRTLYMDESDGALDKEKATDFIRLYRAMLNTGDFETCFFISHNPDLIAMADYEIDFAKL